MTLINLLIGLGVFLFGMVQLERSMEILGGGWIKRWLAQTTSHPAGSVLTGTTITAVVQSSSMVSLVVLAFASAGIIPLFNAVGVLLGANLGTTFTGWVVATVGFKLNLETAALPAIGLGCLIQVFGDRKNKWRAGGALLFGFGLLLFGLNFMKEAVANLPEQIPMDQLRELNALSYLLLGIVLTAVIQSSSATMMIALAALHSQIITLPGAAALIIGADLGTTSTTVLGSLKGFPIKRQLALAHLMFNLVVDMLAFLLLLPALPLVLQWIKLEDPLYALVAFHSSFNLLGLCLFIPVLKPYSRWIGRQFIKDKQSTAILNDVPTEVPEAAISACRQQVQTVVLSALLLNLRNLHIKLNKLQLSPTASALLNNATQDNISFERRYEALKQQEGELLHYSARLQQQTLNEEQSKALGQLLDCARDAVYATKTLKDIRSNLMELRHSLAPSLQEFSHQYRSRLKYFYQQMAELFAGQHHGDYVYEQLRHLSQINEQLHEQMHVDIQGLGAQGASESEHTIEPEQLSTLLNINREVWHSGHNLLQAFQHWHKV